MPNVALRNINQFALVNRDTKEILKLNVLRSDVDQMMNVQEIKRVLIDNVFQFARLTLVVLMQTVMEFDTKQFVNVDQD
jgi:hypothetical protein